MANSSQPPAAHASATSLLLPVQSGWADLDDVSFGCECADPSLQIACWGQEASEGSAAAGPPT